MRHRIITAFAMFEEIDEIAYGYPECEHGLGYEKRACNTQVCLAWTSWTPDWSNGNPYVPQ